MSNPKAALQATAVQQQCKLLRLPMVGSQCADLAELAVKEKQSHLDYLEALLAAVRALVSGPPRAGVTHRPVSATSRQPWRQD